LRLIAEAGFMRSSETMDAVGRDAGAELREAREQRAISLGDVAKATKIPLAALDAIETNRLDRLPQPFYLRGFLRAYARHVGLDPDDTVTRYFRFNQIEPVVQDQPFAPPEPIDDGDRWAVVRQWLVIVLVVAASVTGYRVARSRPLPAAPAAQTSLSLPLDVREIATAGLGVPAPARAATAETRAAAPTEAGVAASTETRAVASTEAGAFHLEIRIDGSCWLSVTTDGTVAVYRLMEAGEQQAFDVRREAVLRIGDPSAFTFSINGTAGRVLGPAGQAVTARITSDNYREFLGRQTLP
jgi:cytoskeletal protein RodZ